MMITEKTKSNPHIFHLIWTKGLRVVLVACILFAATEFFSELSFYLAGKIYPIWQQFDPDGSYLYISIHHVLQALLALGFIAIIKIRLNKSWSDFGFIPMIGDLLLNGCCNFVLSGLCCRAVSR